MHVIVVQTLVTQREGRIVVSFFLSVCVCTYSYVDRKVNREAAECITLMRCL